MFFLKKKVDKQLIRTYRKQEKMSEPYAFHILGRVKMLASESFSAESLTVSGAIKAAKALVLIHMHKTSPTSAAKAWHLVADGNTYIAAFVRRHFLKTYQVVPDPIFEVENEMVLSMIPQDNRSAELFLRDSKFLYAFTENPSDAYDIGRLLYQQENFEEALVWFQKHPILKTFNEAAIIASFAKNVTTAVRLGEEKAAVLAHGREIISENKSNSGLQCDAILDYYEFGFTDKLYAKLNGRWLGSSMAIAEMFAAYENSCGDVSTFLKEASTTNSSLYFRVAKALLQALHEPHASQLEVLQRLESEIDTDFLMDPFERYPKLMF